MKIWNAAPLLRLLFPFMAGILVAVQYPFWNSFFIPGVCLLFILVIIFTFTSKINRSYRISWLYGIIITTLFFLIGYQLTILKTDQFSPAHFSKFTKETGYVYVRVASSCVEKEKSVKVVVEILTMQNNRKVNPVFGKAVIYFQKDHRSLALNNGDELVLKNKFRDIPSAKNPEEFNYNRFLFFKGIYQQAYLKTNEWIYTGNNSGNLFVNYALRLRNKLLSVFQAAHLQGDEYAVAAALLIGYTDKLDPDLLSAYSQTGVLHVLSVSGMHVAIVFVVFNRILFFLERLKYGRLLKTLLLIFFLWFYAFLSGLSPSVLRSATMFSFIVVAGSLKRNSTIYNTLSASALFLLLWNPYLIMDAGFQLSYLAVAGIVFIQPFLSNLLTTQNWLLNQLKALVSVSIAAQLATLPVSLFYFHQFPNYFLLSNMVVIPLSTCIIYMGMLLIAVSATTFLFKYTAIVFSKITVLLNAIVVCISKLPYALTDGIYIGLPEMLLLYGLIITLHFFFTKNKLVFLKLSLLIIIAILVFQVMKQQERYKQKKIIIYALRGITAIDFISAREHVLLLDTTYLENDHHWMQHMKQNWCRLGLSIPPDASVNGKKTFVDIRQNIMQFYDRKLIVLSDAERTKELYKMNSVFPVDYVVITKNIRINILQIRKVYKPTCIVLDENNSSYSCKRWEKECAQFHQPYYSLADSGAFIVEL